MERDTAVTKETSQEEAGASGLGWAQDQLYQLKADVGQIQQQMDQFQAMATQTMETLRTVEASLREVSLGASQTPRIQEELNQAVALIVHLQDQQVEQTERLDGLQRQRETEGGREQEEWSEVARRTEQLERSVATWHDRQAGVDEVGRRFQEGLSLLRQQIQQIEQRLESAETKAASGLEGANRAEHTLTQVEAAVEALQREDETLAERTRLAADVSHRLEVTMTEHLQELKRLELLADRIELHRAERQRLEDRALRLEEELGDLRERVEKGEEVRSRLSGQQQGLASRLAALQEHVTEQRTALAEQIRKLISTTDRTKRRQVQELERELREMKQYVADLAER